MTKPRPHLALVGRTVAKRFDDAVLLPVRAQRARTPDDPTGYIARHELAFHTPRPGFEAAIACGIVALRDYAAAYEEQYGAPIGQSGYESEYWESWVRSINALLTCDIGRLDGGFCSGMLCNLWREAGCEGEL